MTETVRTPEEEKARELVLRVLIILDRLGGSAKRKKLVFHLGGGRPKNAQAETGIRLALMNRFVESAGGDRLRFSERGRKTIDEYLASVVAKKSTPTPTNEFERTPA